MRDVPERIVCLTEEPTEILYLLGEQDRIVGISAYTVRPERASEEKPVVSAFIGGSIEKIAALEPDLVIGFSDIQAQLAHDLIEANQQVLIFNQRSVEEILDVIRMIGRLVGAEERAVGLIEDFAARIEAARVRTARASRRPRVYFEEWDDPLISGIQWVSELVELAGGRNVFAERASGKQASERFVTHREIIAEDPEIIVASWCGKPVDLDSIAGRPGYEGVTAVRRGEVHEMDPAIILQPGPAALTDGLEALERIIRPAS